MKPTREQVTKKIIGLAEVIPFFPQSELGIQLIVDSVLWFVAGEEELEWWAKKCVEVLTKYEGIPYLRAVYSIGFDPADGQPATVEIPGYTPEDMEARFRAREMDENAKRLEAYRAEKQLAPPEDSAPLQLPELKPIPEPGPLKFERCFWCLVESPKGTWDANANACPKCLKPRPTLKQREEHLANTKTMPKDEAERRAEIAELERILGITDKPEDAA